MDPCTHAPSRREEGLFSAGERLARSLTAGGRVHGRSLLPVLRRSSRELRRCCRLLRRRAENTERIPAAWEWLLDNAYLARREALSAAEDLSGAGWLRRCRQGALLLTLTRGLLDASGGAVTEEGAAAFLRGFQQALPLERRELQLFPAALRLAVIERLALCAGELLGGKGGEEMPQRLEALFGTLRLFAALDAEPLLTGADLCHAILCADPSGDYPHMDAATRAEYLDRAAKLARRRGQSEQDCVRELIEEAKERNVHVGRLLCAQPGPLRFRLAFLLWALLSLVLLGLSCRLMGSAALWLLPIPLAAIAKNLVELLLSRLCPARRLPGMDLRAGVPPEGRTLTVISALITSEESAAALCRRLEEQKLACRRAGENLLFGLLADLPEAETEHTPADEALLRVAREGVERLNGRYGGGFFLFTRPRRFDGRRWTGWERKRGALLELARLCRGEESSLTVIGRREALEGVQYLLTLDSDSRLAPGTAETLIGAALHPLNRPEADPVSGVVLRGHGVLQPRLSTDLESAGETDFALVFAGTGGLDLYGGAAGELWQDAFGSCGFAGKGLLHIDALLRCAKAIPPGRVLSHDAVEGAWLRGGQTGEGFCLDRFPARPLAYYKRMHRWLRGDWQNLPFLFRRELPGARRALLGGKLLRALLPPATLLAILAGLFLPGRPLALAAGAALLALLDDLLRAGLAALVRRRQGPRQRRFARALLGLGGAIVHSLLALWLLPYEAWICLSAMVTALWRMAVSHRNLLQWQTAAQAEQSGRGLGTYLPAFWPAALLGLGCLLLSPGVLGRSTGLLWLLSPLLAYALSLPARREESLTDSEREELLEAARESFRYFALFCRSEDHWLPPDNVQEQPPRGKAHRTSPTNIGMAMASALAAAELSLIGRRDALALLGHITDTLERMPRCRGHFYNWYDTRTLSPLLPPSISTVDSGNLCACLIAVEQGLRLWGEEELAGRLEALIREMDFSFLFDEKRELFYISYDPEKDRGAGGWYDLLASEAMLTSYLALARGEATLRHWRRLGRGLLQQDGYRGLASWTGTMFEYLMPALFLPYPHGSLLGESGRFCLYVQKRRRLPGKPWGISESAYYALDPALSYRYKASGCGALALRRGQDEDLVTAPYAAFLALAADPRAAIRDLRLFRRCGALGPWGYYEAIDFTPARCREGEGQVVRCVMAHHAGMSVLAAANALTGGLMRRLFLQDPALAACLPLLQERLPEGGALLRRSLSREPERPPREPDRHWERSGSRGEGEEQRCLLTNGGYELQLDSLGRSEATARGLTLYGDEDLKSPGIETALVFNKAPLPLGRRPERWELSESRAGFLWETEGLSLREEICLSPMVPGERRVFSLYAPEGGEGGLCLRLRPLLAPWRDLCAHPAYWVLGVEREQAEGALLLHRLPRGEHTGLWLGIAADRTFEEAGERELRLRFPFTLSPGRGWSLRLSLCLGESREQALDGAKAILPGEDRSMLLGALAQRLGMEAREIGAAFSLLRQLPKPLSAAAPRRELWPWGISGDEPLLCCDGQDAQALPLLRRFLLLKSCGRPGELVILSREEGEYRQPLHREIGRLLSAWGLEALLGARGGIHFAPPEAAPILRSRSAVFWGEPLWRFLPARPPRLSGPRHPGMAPDYRFEEGSFSFEASPLPSRAWQHCLSNGHLGVIAADCGTAALWLDNARELPLTEPMEDVYAAQPPELIWVETEEGPRSLFGANDGIPCHVEFGPGWARWEKKLAGRDVVTELSLTPWQNARVLLIRGAEELTLRWLLPPRMAPEDGSSLRVSFSEGLFRAENPESGREGLRLLAGTGSPCSCRTDFTPGAMLLQIRGEALTVLCCGCCDETELRKLLRPGAALSAGAESRGQWQRLLGDRKWKTGYEDLDRYLQPWALYQTLACRLLGRASLYQRGGAYGFRDQLQDAVNLLPLEPGYARERILDACRHQYEEGDVMHWWHPLPQGDRGLRSRCSDDLLWLPWALCEYVAATGDLGLCAREECWRSSPPLDEGERDRYEQPEERGAATVLSHARRALECFAARGFGTHGLPFFGSGDWNDAMDRVDGESVWLGWFASQCAWDFAALLERLGERGAEEYRSLSQRLGRAAESAWNGRWYRRGYWADGESLGGEGRIDLLPTAWAALNPWADPNHVQISLDACLRRLVDEEQGIVKLFAPPFAEGERSPGSILGYGQGFRENGGQYTHGAVWLARACFRQGRREDGLRLLRMLLPENHDPRRYEAEPFVLAADVSAAPGREGQAGWTWYTGSAGWFFRVAWEELAEENPECGDEGEKK